MRALSSPEGETPPADREHRGAAWILALACLLALVRLFRLGEWGLWIDEAYTWVDLNRNLDSDQIFNPEGYRAIGALVELLGGRPDEVALRLLPALVGILCVPLTAWAFRPLVGPRGAALAALLVAASSWHVFWSQSARFYTFAQAVSLCGTGLFVRGLFGRPKRAIPWLIAGVLVTAAALRLHPTAAFLLPGLAVGTWCAYWLSLERRPELRTGALLLAGLAALGLIVLWFLGRDMLSHHARQKPVASAVSGVVHLAKTCGYFFTPWLLTAAAIGALEGVRRRAGGAVFLACAALTSFGVAALIATRAQMTAQYVFVALPWVAVLATVPLNAAASRAGSRALALGYFALLLLPSLGNTGLYFSLRGGERAPWKAAYEYVAEHRQEGEMILGMGSAIGEFYLGGKVDELRRPTALVDLAEWFPNGPRRWNRHDRKLWIVVRPQWIEGFRDSDRGALERWLAEDCRMVKRFPGEMEGRDLAILVYVRE